MNVNWNYISICNNIFLGPYPHTYHPTKIPHLALKRWHFMAVMIITSIYRWMLLHFPKISFSFSYFRSKQSENIVDQDQEFWTDLVKWYFQEMKCMIKIMSFTWEQRKWTTLAWKWHIWKWWTEAPLYYNLLITYMKNCYSEWLLFPYFMLGYFSASPISVKP